MLYDFVIAWEGDFTDSLTQFSNFVFLKRKISWKKKKKPDITYSLGMQVHMFTSSTGKSKA